MTLVIPQTILAVGKGVGTSIQSFFKSSSASAKIAKTGLALAVAGGGIAVGTSVASKGIVEAGETTSKGFGIPTELIFIIGAVILAIILLGGKRR